MTEINILNNGIDMIKLFSDKEGFKEQGKNFNHKNKNNTINNFTSIDNKLINNKLNNKLNNNKLSIANEIENLTNPPIQYETNRLELNNYSDMLL
jgi:type IV secretory pathway component VirB8